MARSCVDGKKHDRCIRPAAFEVPRCRSAASPRSREPQSARVSRRGSNGPRTTASCVNVACNVRVKFGARVVRPFKGRGYSFLDFLWAFVSDWSLAMSGPLSVPLAIVGVFLPNEIARIMLFATAALCLILGSFSVWRRERIQVLAGVPRLDIVYTASERRFNEVIREHLHWNTRHLSVCVKNAGNTATTNCQLYFDNISPNDGNLATGLPLVSSPFILNGSEAKFFPLVSFQELEHETLGTLHVQVDVEGKLGERVFEASKEYTVTLRATAAECDATVGQFSFWVHKNELKMEPI